MTAQLGEIVQRICMGHTLNYAQFQCDCGTEFESLVTSKAPLCRKCELEQQRLEGMERDRERMADLTAREVPRKFAWAISLDAPELGLRVKPRSAIEKARASLDAPNIGLIGPAGFGKTSLACALLREIAARHNTVGRFVTSFALAEARRQNRLGQGEANIIAQAMKARVLVVDEIGAEQSRDLAVDEVIRVRHDEERPTIWTSGFNRADLAERYGAGLERRLFEATTLLCLGGSK